MRVEEIVLTSMLEEALRECGFYSCFPCTVHSLLSSLTAPPHPLPLLPLHPQTGDGEAALHPSWGPSTQIRVRGAGQGGQPRGHCCSPSSDLGWHPEQDIEPRGAGDTGRGSRALHECACTSELACVCVLCVLLVDSVAPQCFASDVTVEMRGARCLPSAGSGLAGCLLAPARCGPLWCPGCTSSPAGRSEARLSVWYLAPQSPGPVVAGCTGVKT